jgi:hypothetical protein
MASIDVCLKLSVAQLTALDKYIDYLEVQAGFRISRSQAIRSIVGMQIRNAGFEWPVDSKLGGDRRSRRNGDDE